MNSFFTAIWAWLAKAAAKSATDAVALTLDALVKQIQAVPPEDYAKLASMLEAFLASLVAKLGPAHPATRVLAATRFKTPPTVVK